MTFTSPSPSTADTDGHCSYHRRVFRTVQRIAETTSLDKALEFSAAHSSDLFGYELNLDELLSLYRFGQHLVNKDTSNSPNFKG